MGDSDITSVQIHGDTWKRLNRRKEQGDTFEDVIIRLLDRDETPQPPESDKEPPIDLHPEPEQAQDIEWAIEEAVSQWDDEPDDRRQRRIETLRCALEAVRDEPRSKKELQEECYDDVPGQNERTWYRKTVRPALELVAEYDNSTRKQHWTGRP